MANSRKLRNRSKDGDLPAAFERALEAILARVSISASRQRPSSIAVAHSGGLDSSVLLHLASRYAATHDLTLYAFHVHHGLSPNADAWLTHCQHESDKRGIVFAACKVAVVDHDKRGVEEAARIARYAGLGEMCRSHGVPLLLTAHHQDDQAETVLLQLMRGAGLPGLSGMSAVQAQHELLGAGVALGRPLLGTSRAMLEQVMRQHDLQHIEDESNSDIRYRRNALRHTISPVIDTYFPGFATLVARTASHIQSAQSLLHDLALIDLEVCKADQRGETLDLSRIKELSAERTDNLLRHWLYKHGVQLPSTSRLDEICGQMLHAASDMHPFFDFRHVRLHRVENRLELHPNLGLPPEEPVTLQWRGEHQIDIPQWHGKLVFERTEGFGLEAAQLHGTPLVLRPRTGRERLKIAANRPSKSLKSLFQESQVAPWRRAWLPLVYLEMDLVFVAGLGMDSRHLSQGQRLTLCWHPA